MPVCVLCGEDTFRPLPYTYSFKERSIGIVQCSGCGLGALDPMLSQEEVRGMYLREYFDRDYHCGTTAGSYADEVGNMRAEFKSTLEILGNFRRGGVYLEIGCAGGAALAEAHDFGYTTVGVDFSSDMAAWGRDHLQVDIRVGSLEEQRFPDESFDVVFMGDVIEHILRPKDDLREIRRVMKPGGILALAYPMELNHLVPRLRGLFQIHHHSKGNPYHLFYYSPRTLSRLLDLCGFDTLMHREYKMVRHAPLVTRCVDIANAAISRLTGKWCDRGFLVARVRK